MFNLFLNNLLQLLLASVVFAAPVTTQGHGNAFNYGLGGGLLGFVVLVLDIIVFIEVIKSSRPVPHKLAWCVLVFLFPIVGIIIYWLFSDRAAHNHGGYEAIA